MVLGGIQNALAHVRRGVVFQRPAAARAALDSTGLGSRKACHVGVLVAPHSISSNDEYLTAGAARGKLRLIIN
jgi:hypothetical protein